MDASRDPLSDAEDSVESAVVVEFLRLYAADRDAGRPRDVSAYRARFPGFEAMIEAEFDRLARHEPPGADASVSIAGTTVSDPAELARTIAQDRYEVLETIGRGGMGVVSRVRDRRLGRDLAMKVIAERPNRKPGTGSNSVHWRRFVDEAQITGQLAHPGIVPVHDLGIDEQGRVYFTMALVRGEDFRSVIDRVHEADDDGWTLSRALQVVIRVCEAVAFAHANGVIHRDLKPTNVMVGAFGEAYVLDWGLARLRDADRRAAGPGDAGTDESSPSRTMAGDVIGTPAYMSPEQARGDHDRVDFASDVYSIGAMLFHLLSGAAPFAEEPSSRVVLRRVVDGPPPDLGASAPRAAPELVAICEKAMARDPSARYPSVDALAEDLRAFADMRVVRAFETGALAEARKWVRRNRALAITGLVAVLALAIGLVFSIVQKRTAEQQTRVAEAQRLAADRQAARADKNFELAREVVDRMVARVASTELADVPGMSEVRRDLMLEAVGFQRLLDDGSPHTSGELGRVLVRLALIHNALDELDAAEAAALESVTLLERGLAGESDRAAFALSLMDARKVLAEVARDRESFEDAERELSAGAAVADRWTGRGVHELEFLRRNARIVNVRAELARRQRHRADAGALRREAAELALRAVDLGDGSASDRLFAGMVLRNLAMNLAQNGEFDAAESTIRDALTRLESATPGDPSERERRHVLGVAWDTLAMILGRTGRLDDGIDAGGSSVRIQTEVCRDFPGIARFRHELGRCLGNLAKLRYERGDGATSREQLVESIDHLAAAVALAPDNLTFRRTLVSSRKTRCSLLIADGRARDAAMCAARLGADSPIDGALYLSVCVGLTSADRTLPADDRDSDVREFTDLALELLHGILPTHEDVEGSRMLLQKPEFDPIRDEDSFRELERILERRRSEEER
ncbi:MAG: serine/threonine protein kinase [Planctomycetes bacterium]|nr:serine/threonine protein kinase [Planctomycetota bacterium]